MITKTNAYIRETIHRVHYSFIRTVTSDTVAGS